MMSEIGPGDWVECIKSLPYLANGKRNPFPVYNRKLYNVIAVGVSESGYAVLMVYRPGDIAVDDIGKQWRYDGHLVEHFRLLYRPKADLIKSLKSPMIVTA